MWLSAQLRAELDACYACPYDLTRDELRYTPIGVDPKEAYREDPATGSGQVSVAKPAWWETHSRIADHCGSELFLPVIEVFC